MMDLTVISGQVAQLISSVTDVTLTAWAAVVLGLLAGAMGLWRLAAQEPATAAAATDSVELPDRSEQRAERRELKRANQVIEDYTAEIAALSEQLTERDGRIEALVAEMDQRNTLSARQRRAIKTRDAEIARLEAELAVCNSELARVRGPVDDVEEAELAAAHAEPPVVLTAPATHVEAVDGESKGIREMSAHMQLLEGQLQYWQYQVSRLDERIRGLDGQTG